MPKIIKVQKIPRPEPKAGQNPSEDLLEQFCYYFQQYTLAQARKLPQVRIRHMLKTAEKEYALHMLDQLEIVTAPYTKKSQKVIDNIRSRYTSILNN